MTSRFFRFLSVRDNLRTKSLVVDLLFGWVRHPPYEPLLSKVLNVSLVKLQLSRERLSAMLLQKVLAEL